MRPDLSRRDAIKAGVAGATGMVLAGAAGAQTRPTTSPSPKAKSVIQIWLWGGPPHLDTFDPKPEAGADYCGPFTSPIATNVDGIRICELLPLLAQQADKYSIIRSMTHGNNGHETAAYLVQTGRNPGDRIVYPSVGAVVSYYKGYDAGYKGLIPPYIVITEPQGRFSEAGFLGPKYKPFATGGDPAAAQFTVEGIVAPGITRQRQEDRRELLGKLNALGNLMPDDPELVAARAAEERAYELILGEEGKVFDLGLEKDEMRDLYGRTRIGQSCLLARRMVERGIPYITINYGGWDTHKANFAAMRSRLPQMDKAMSALLTDLKDRGLLDSTIIWWGGEFGRTPRIDKEPPWDGGRGHHGACFCSVVAGGGFKGGRVVGASDARGERVKDRPVYPCDLIGSIYELMGIDPHAKLRHPQGMEVSLTPSAEDAAPTGGRLKEIM